MTGSSRYKTSDLSPLRRTAGRCLQDRSDPQSCLEPALGFCHCFCLPLMIGLIFNFPQVLVLKAHPVFCLCWKWQNRVYCPGKMMLTLDVCNSSSNPVSNCPLIQSIQLFLWQSSIYPPDHVHWSTHLMTQHPNIYSIIQSIPTTSASSVFAYAYIIHQFNQWTTFFVSPFFHPPKYSSYPPTHKFFFPFIHPPTNIWTTIWTLAMQSPTQPSYKCEFCTNCVLDFVLCMVDRRDLTFWKHFS